jgi:desulfoferrodoxin (superoxide reductase-like protein)
MKKLAILLCGLLALSTAAFAHPPSDIKIQFDDKLNTLTAVIEHPVSNPDTHYIKKIDIGLNGKEIETLTFTEQDNNAAQIVIIALPQATKGDVLSVEAYCNQSGKLEKEIKVA